MATPIMNLKKVDLWGRYSIYIHTIYIHYIYIYTIYIHYKYIYYNTTIYIYTYSTYCTCETNVEQNRCR